MKLLLTETEMRNIVSCLKLEDIKSNSDGEYKKWDVQLTENGYTLDYIFDEKGNFKPEYKIKEDEK